MADLATLAITNGDGLEVECSPVVEAMIIVLLKADDEICGHREGVVELHYVRKTAKVAGKLKAHVGLERIRKES